MFSWSKKKIDKVTKLSGIDSSKERIDMACSNLEAMAIYVVNQVSGNDI